MSFFVVSTIRPSSLWWSSTAFGRIQKPQDRIQNSEFRTQELESQFRSQKPYGPRWKRKVSPMFITLGEGKLLNSDF
jgi:hypothetical protein